MSLCRAPRVLLAIASVATVLAADPSPTPTPAPTPEPNSVDLSGMSGIYRGRSKVSIDSGVFHTGRAKTRIFTPGRLSALARIDAAVSASAGRTASIGNVLTFSPGGIFRAGNLAPGVLSQGAVQGLYHATRRLLTFSGTYTLGKATGRFSGTLYVSKNRRFRLQYSIFPGESVTAAYSYEYTGKPVR